MQNPLCDRCGEMEERAQLALGQADSAHRRAEAAIVDMQNLEADLRAARRKIKALQREIVHQQREDPMMAVAQLTFEHWNDTLRDGKARAFTGKRLANVLARLNEGYTLDDLKRAINGAKEGAYEKDGVRYDDLELICRDPTLVDRFMARGARITISRFAGTPKVAKAQALTELLESVYGKGIQDQWGETTKFPCPACGAGENGDVLYRPLVINHAMGLARCEACHEEGRYLAFCAQRKRTGEL